MLAGLALGFVAGLAAPFIAGILAYRWIADPPRRKRSTHQRRPAMPRTTERLTRERDPRSSLWRCRPFDPG